MDINELRRRREEYLREALRYNVANPQWSAFLRGKAAAMEDMIYEINREKKGE